MSAQTTDVVTSLPGGPPNEADPSDSGSDTLHDHTPKEAVSPEGEFPAWHLIPIALLAWCAGMAYLPAFGMRALLPVVTAAAVAPVVLSLLVSRLLRYPLWTATALGLMAGLVAASLVVYRDSAAAGALPTPELVRDMGASIVDAPQKLLGTILPARPEPGLLILVFANVWAVAFGGAELALRGRGRITAVLPAALTIAAVPLVVVGGAATETPVTVLAVVAACVFALLRAPSEAGRITPRVAGAVAPGVVLALVAVAVSTALPGTSRHAVDLRGQVSAGERTEVVGVNPLDRISAWLADPHRPMFRVSTPDATPEQLWRLTVFDRYDGVSWHPVTRLEATGGRIPEAGEAAPKSIHVAQEITLDKLPGPWLPTAERPTQVQPEDGSVQLAVDADAGVVASTAKFSPGTHYSVESAVPVHEPQDIQYAPVADDPENTDIPLVDAAGTVIDAVASLREQAQTATAGSAFPYQQALRLAEWLRTKYTYAPAAVPGHGYRNLQFFLESTKQGTSEQFAAAFAVMARTLNLPTRVVVGFRSSPAVDGTVQVHAGDVLAWAEVHFEGIGWVPFFPTPEQSQTARTAPAPPENPAQAPPPPATPREQAAPADRAEADARIREAERDGAAAPAEDAEPGTPWWLWAAAVAAACSTATTLVVAVPATGSAWRRRRRTRGSPEQRVRGAWAQAEDQLRRVGMPRTDTLTTGEVVAFGRRRLGAEAGEALSLLARFYGELVYGESDLVVEQDAFRKGAGDDADPRRSADLAWRCCAEVEAAVRAAASRHAALRSRAQSSSARTANRSVSASSKKSNA